MAVFFSGKGTLGSPYGIHTAAAFKYWFEVAGRTASHAMLVADIDMSGVPVTAPGGQFLGNINGNGRGVYNLSLGGSTTYFRNSIFNISFHSMVCEWFFFAGFDPSTSFLSDCGFYDCEIPSGSFALTSNRVVVSQLSITDSGFIVNDMSTTNCYVVDGAVSIPKFTDLRSNVNPYAKSNFLGFSDTVWLFDEVSPPRLLKKDITSITQGYCVKGTTKVGGRAASRICRSHGSLDMNMVDKTKSDANGNYLLKCGPYSDHVFVTHADDYGNKFTASKSYALGDVIHPTMPNGYRYICTKAGKSAATGPTNWPTAGTLTSGSAIFTAQPVYKPEMFIAVPVLIDLLTGLPV